MRGATSEGGGGMGWDGIVRATTRAARRRRLARRPGLALNLLMNLMS